MIRLALVGALVALVVGVLGCGRRDPPVVREWRGTASELRGLEFERTVPFSEIEPADIPELLLRELPVLHDQQYMRAYRDAYAALGVLPPEIDLVQTYLQLNQDQLAGLYSVRERHMYVVRSGEQANGSIVVHELIHALQHQHFEALLELMQGLRRNDDVATSIAAALEGDATLVMLLSEAGPPYRLSPEIVAGFRQAMLRDLQAPTGALADVPRIMRESLLFPYARGLLLASDAYASSGRAGLDALLGDPPLSSQAVRTPGQAATVDFVGLPDDLLQRVLDPQGCELGHDNVAGVLTLGVLLKEYGQAEDADELLADWRGDRFAHAYCDQRWELIWLIRWRSESAAREFVRRYTRIAPEIGKHAPLSTTPAAIALGETALVATGAWSERAKEIAAAADVRTFEGLEAWLRGDCYPESPCPLGSR